MQWILREKKSSNCLSGVLVPITLPSYMAKGRQFLDSHDQRSAKDGTYIYVGNCICVPTNYTLFWSLVGSRSKESISITTEGLEMRKRATVRNFCATRSLPIAEIKLVTNSRLAQLAERQVNTAATVKDTLKSWALAALVFSRRVRVRTARWLFFLIEMHAERIWSCVGPQARNYETLQHVSRTRHISS